MNLATRDAYGNALVKLSENKNIVVLDADLGGATKSINFKKVAPERFFDMGIAECDMIGTAAGLSTCGKIPFASTFAVFATGRAYDQIRNTVCYPNLNVKVVGSHAGVTVGADGGSHEALEDIALMRALPNMVVICPSDDVEAEQATYAAAEHYGPVYIRTGRSPVPTFHGADYKFEIGKGEVLAEGTDALIISTGLMTAYMIDVVKSLAEAGKKCALINMPTIKPLDEELVLKYAAMTDKVVTVEEHSVIGGLGGAVSELLSQKMPKQMKLIGTQDRFGQSGDPNSLLEEYGLSKDALFKSIMEF